MNAKSAGPARFWPSGPEFKKGMPDAAVNLIVTTIGVLLGLYLSGLVSDRSDDAVYQAIANSVHAEAEANKAALDGSFNAYVLTRSGLVLNEFRVDVAVNSLANPIFLRKAKPQEIEALNRYVRSLSLADGYALMARQLAMASIPDSAQRGWGENLYNAWSRNLKDCSTSIGEILAIQ
jgi:hypothetical protein